MSLRPTLRALIADNLGNDQLATGVVAASPTPTASALKIAALVGFPPATVTDKWLTLSSGTYKDQDRLVASYDDIGQLVTLQAALTGAPTAADKVEIYKQFKKTEYDAAISQAIESAKTAFLYNKVNRDTVIVSGTYEYLLPTGFASVSRLMLESSTGRYDAEIPQDYWEFIIKGGVPAVYIKFFNDCVNNYAGYHIEIQGQAYPTVLTDDTSTTSVPDSYIIAWASCSMATRKTLAANDTEGWINKVNNWRAAMREIIAMQRRPAAPGSVIVPLETSCASIAALTGMLGATAWVVANTVPTVVREFAVSLAALGFPVWVCDGVNDQLDLQAAHDSLPDTYGDIACSGRTFTGDGVTPLAISKSSTNLHGVGSGGGEGGTILNLIPITVTAANVVVEKMAVMRAKITGVAASGFTLNDVYMRYSTEGCLSLTSSHISRVLKSVLSFTGAGKKGIEIIDSNMCFIGEGTSITPGEAAANMIGVHILGTTGWCTDNLLEHCNIASFASAGNAGVRIEGIYIHNTKVFSSYLEGNKIGVDIVGGVTSIRSTNILASYFSVGSGQIGVKARNAVIVSLDKNRFRDPGVYVDFDSTVVGVDYGTYNAFQTAGLITDTSVGKLKNCGVATLVAGQTSITVAHILINTPAFVNVTPVEDTGGKRFWRDTIGATNFVIHIDSAHSADIDFAWSAEADKDYAA